MVLLKLNLKYYLRYFKTGTILDNYMKFEISEDVIRKTANDVGACGMLSATA